MDIDKTKGNLLHILLVEDNKHEVLAFNRIFKESGLNYKITHFTRAEAALKYLKEPSTPIDLLVCDHHLPGMLGFDLCKLLLEQNIGIPLVLLTGAGAESLAVEAIKVGVDDYIVKDSNQGYLKLLPVILPEVVRKHSDRLARQQVETLLAKRERYLGALVQVQQILLALDSPDDHFYREILKLLGQTGNASRAYVFENYKEASGNLAARCIAKWRSDTYSPKPALEMAQYLSYEQDFPRWAAILEQDNIITGLVSNFPLAEREILEAQGIITILILPLIVNGQFFGFLGFDNQVDTQAWDPTEIDLLRAAAAGISMWQERRHAADQLREYTSKLQAHNEELDAFAHTVAHDLQNPLSALTGIAEILAKDHTDKGFAQYLHSIVRSGRKATNIVNELLLLASIRKQEDITLAPLEMNKIIEETQDRLIHMIDAYEASFDIPDTWPPALGHAPWIEEVWANYISNGLKYGGQPPHLTLGAVAQEDGQIRFWVRDNGPGLTPEEQAQLFTPFTKLKQVQAKGYGLGLSIVRRIVGKFGGQVGVESPEDGGPGSLFFFTLPPAKIDTPEVRAS